MRTTAFTAFLSAMRAEPRAVLSAAYKPCIATITARSSLKRSSQGMSGIYPLARARVCRDDLAVAGGHNAGNTRAATQKKTCRRSYHKHYHQGEFDKFLPLITVPKVVKGSHFIPPGLSQSSRGVDSSHPAA